MWHMVTQPGIEPMPTAMEARSLNPWTTREIRSTIFTFYFLLIFLKFIYWFIFGCAGSSRLCAGFSLVVASGGYYRLVVSRLLIAVAPLIVEHRLCGRGLGCPRGMWLSSQMRDQTGEPTLAGGVLSTGPPGKSRCITFKPWLWPIERSYHWLSVGPPAS